MALHHFSIAAITSWEKHYFGKPLSSNTIWSYIHKYHLKLHCAKKKSHVNHVQKWCQLVRARRHLGWKKTFTIARWIFFPDPDPFLEETNTVCSRPKTKRTIQTVISNKSSSLTWCSFVSVYLVMVIYTYVMVALMQKNTEILEQHILLLRWHLFQGCHFSAR